MAIGAAYINLLESSTVTSSDADSSYPLANLSDRDIGKPFKFNSATAPWVKADQGAAGTQAVDLLFIPAGHNLDGLRLTLEHNSTDSWAGGQTTASQWTQSGSGQIVKTFAGVTDRWWRLTVDDGAGGNPGVVPEFAELFLTSLYTFERDASRRASGPFGNVRNVEDLARADGAYRSLKHGAALRRRNYIVPLAPAAQYANFETLLAATYNEGVPFLLHDHDGAYIWSRISGDPNPKQVSYGVWSFGFECVEVVP
jgi:hypothetical protein